MNNLGISFRWIFGGLLCLLSLLGLFMASRAQDDAFYLAGLMIFLFSVLFIFGLIGRYVGNDSHHGTSHGA